MNAREQALALLRVAGYHGDQRAWMRAYTERRISYAVARKIWAEGQRARASGVKCTCVDCAAGEVAS